jgi:hypothetical protein
MKPRIVSWFSCGTASAVTAKLVLARYASTHEVVVARCVVPEEHPDNERFAVDCEAWFDHPVVNLKSDEYASCEEVWTRTRYMAGVGGARCTVEMKKAVRHRFERDFDPQLQAFGYTAEEGARAQAFRAANPEIALVTPLIEAGLDKEACHALVIRAGLVLPQMYRDGFANANCIGCVLALSPSYWNRVRRLYPAVFARRAALSRDLGVRLVKTTRGARERLFLDELPEDDLSGEEPKSECSLLCYLAEQTIAPGLS